MEPVVFRQWANKKWAVLASLHKVIIIGTLCVSYQLVARDGAPVQPDSSQTGLMMELEEVEATGKLPGELEEVSLKPLLLVTSRDISEAAATSHEALLEYLPQVDIRQRGQHGTQADLSMQGGTFDESLMLLNGINLSDPQSGHFQLNLPLDLDAVRRMEVVTGSAARRFGTSAFTGAVNVITQPSNSTFFNGGVKTGQHRFYKARMLGNVHHKSMATLVSLSSAGSNGYRENTDFRTTHAFVHARVGKGRLKYHLMAGLNSRAYGANGFYSPRYAYQYEETLTGLAALKTELEGARIRWTFNAYYRMNRDHFLLDRHNPSFYSNDHRTLVAGADLEGRASTVAGITHGGVHYRAEQIMSTSLGEPLPPEKRVPVNDSVTLTHGDLRNQFNWNMNHTWEHGPLTLSGGFMLHMNSGLAYRPSLFPGIELRWRLPASLRMVASANRSMRLPTYTDLYYRGPDNVGNPKLEPERATTLEMGIYRSGHGWQMGMNGFYRQGSNLIDWIWMEDEKWHTMNLSRVDAAGGDLLLQYRQSLPGHGYLRIKSAGFSYTFTHLTRVSQQVTSRYVLDNLRHKVTGGISLCMAGRLLLSVKITGQDRNGTYLAYDMDTGNSVEKPYDPFLLVDAKLDYALGRLHLILETTNLLDACYNDIGNVPQPGRWTLLGLEIR